MCSIGVTGKYNDAGVVKWGGEDRGRQAEERIWGGITNAETSETVKWKPATVGTS